MARRPKVKSRPQRWGDAVSKGLDAIRDVEEWRSDRDAQETEEPEAIGAEDGAEVPGEIEEAINLVQDALEELVSIQEEYQDWQDNLPEGLDQSPVAEKLEEVTGIDLEYALDQAGTDPLEMDVDAIVSALEEAESADLPLGFGRD